MSETEEGKKLSEAIPFIQGENIDLMPGRLEWAEHYCRWMNSPTVRRFSRNPMPRSLEEIKKWFESPPEQQGMKDFIVFTIWHKKDKKPIGQVGLNHIHWFNRWANAFIHIGETEYWGKNIATETTNLLLKYAFEEVNLNKVSGGVAIDNVGSWTVAEKLGFKFEGILKEEFYIDGEYKDVKMYCYLKKDWMEKKRSQKEVE